jgi:hypothetical protein
MQQDTGSDRFAAELRAFGPVGILAMLGVLAGNFLLGPLKGFPVLAWAHWSRTPWRDIGYVRPKSWIRTAAIGIVFGVAFKLVMKAIVMPLFGAPPINEAYHYVTGNAAVLPGLFLTMIVGAAFGEETMYRGYLFERLTKLLGSGAAAKAAIVLLTSALFGLAHYHDLGVTGVEQALITGLTFGTIFAITGRIWMIMIAHAAFDIAALVLIYLDIETDVAQFIFK